MGIDHDLSVHAACADVGSIGEGRERRGGMGCGIHGTNRRGVSVLYYAHKTEITVCTMWLWLEIYG